MSFLSSPTFGMFLWEEKEREIKNQTDWIRSLLIFEKKKVQSIVEFPVVLSFLLFTKLAPKRVHVHNWEDEAHQEGRMVHKCGKGGLRRN